MQVQSEMPQTQLNFETVTRSLFKFSKDVPVGTEFIGKFTGERLREVTDRESGEVKEVTDLCFEWKKELFAITLDKGLEIAIKDANLTPGMIVKITKKQPIKLDKGTCNQYTIAVAK